MQTQAHLTLKGLERCIALRGHFPLGTSTTLTSAFPNVKSLAMPNFTPSNSPLDPNWISGFVAADGSFFVSVKRRASNTYFSPDFRVVQHSRSISALIRIQTILGGSIKPLQENFVLRINDTQIFIDKIIPFFLKNPLHGTKVSDFSSFCSIINLIKSGKHLTPEGVDQILDIRSKMNSKRYSTGYTQC